MRKMLSLILLSMTCFAVHANGCEWKTVSIPIRGTSLIFDGHDEQLPKNSCFRFSVVFDDSRKPVNLAEAENQIITSMPHWIYREVQESSGEHECVVEVNNLDYFSLLIDFYIERWAKIGVDVEKMTSAGESSGETFQDRMQEHLCKMIKSGK